MPKKRSTAHLQKVSRHMDVVFENEISLSGQQHYRIYVRWFLLERDFLCVCVCICARVCVFGGSSCAMSVSVLSCCSALDSWTLLVSR